jgi:hypothetical protein
MITYKENLTKMDLYSRFKRRPGVGSSDDKTSQSPLQKKYEWFKRRYAKLA